MLKSLLFVSFLATTVARAEISTKRSEAAVPLLSSSNKAFHVHRILADVIDTGLNETDVEGGTNNTTETEVEEEDDHEGEEAEEDDHDDEEDHGDEEEDHHDDEEGEHHDDEEDDHDLDHEEEDHHDDDHHDEKPWGPAIVASLIVAATNLIGIVALAPAILGCSGFSKQTRRLVVRNILPSFACGALLATAVFLMIPEGMLLLGGGHGEEEHEEEDHEDHVRRFLEEEEDHEEHEEDNESEIAWKFGVSLLVGFLLPALLALFVPHRHITYDDDDDDLDAPAQEKAPIADVADDEEFDCDVSYTAATQQKSEQPQETAPPARAVSAATPIDYGLATSILAGDFFHNFADGIFIGTAFLLCDRSVAIAVAAATVFHELAQELGDFFLLTQQAGLTTFVALALNFVTGLSVLLGVLVIFTTDISEPIIGSILVVGAGVYFYVAASECMPRIRAAVKTVQHRILSLVAFAIGAVPIGLVLLNHTHCDAH